MIDAFNIDQEFGGLGQAVDDPKNLRSPSCVSSSLTFANILYREVQRSTFNGSVA